MTTLPKQVLNNRKKAVKAWRNFPEDKHIKGHFFDSEGGACAMGVLKICFGKQGTPTSVRDVLDKVAEKDTLTLKVRGTKLPLTYLNDYSHLTFKKIADMYEEQAIKPFERKKVNK